MGWQIEDAALWFLIVVMIGLALWLFHGSPAIDTALIATLIFVAGSEMLIWRKIYSVDKKTAVSFEMSKIFYWLITNGQSPLSYFGRRNIFEHAQNTAGVSEANMPPVRDWWSPAVFDKMKGNLNNSFIKLENQYQNIIADLNLLKVKK